MYSNNFQLQKCVFTCTRICLQGFEQHPAVIAAFKTQRPVGGKKISKRSFISQRKQATNPYPGHILGTGCLWGPPWVSPAKWQRTRHRQAWQWTVYFSMERGKEAISGMMGAGDAQYASALYNLQPLQCCVNSWGAQHGVLQFPPSPFQHFPFFHARSALSLREHHFRFLLSNIVVFVWMLALGSLPLHPSPLTEEQLFSSRFSGEHLVQARRDWRMLLCHMTWHQPAHVPQTRPWTR